MSIGLNHFSRSNNHLLLLLHTMLLHDRKSLFFVVWPSEAVQMDLGGNCGLFFFHFDILMILKK